MSALEGEAEGVPRILPVSEVNELGEVDEEAISPSGPAPPPMDVKKPLTRLVSK
jgi:hypothetical protein